MTELLTPLPPEDSQSIDAQFERIIAEEFGDTERNNNLPFGVVGFMTEVYENMPLAAATTATGSRIVGNSDVPNDTQTDS